MFKRVQHDKYQKFKAKMDRVSVSQKLNNRLNINNYWHTKEYGQWMVLSLKNLHATY